MLMMKITLTLVIYKINIIFLMKLCTNTNILCYKVLFFEHANSSHKCKKN